MKIRNYSKKKCEHLVMNRSENYREKKQRETHAVTGITSAPRAI